MDERKNVKVVDEHGIDRVANIICSVDIDGTDYVLYFIKRDEENDNLFISKLIKNNDATFNMVNIEDSMEKGKLVEIVKELIKYSVDTELDKTTGSVTLADGKVVTISNVLFNKEQNINVSKTYVTTVKRAVTKVSDKFYSVDSVVPSTPVIEAVPEVPVNTVGVSEVSSTEMPSFEATMPDVPVTPSVVEESKSSELVLPDSIAIDETKQEPVAEAVPVAETPAVIEQIPAVPSVPEVPSVVEPISATPVVPEAPAVVEPILPVTPSVPEAPVAVESISAAPAVPEAPVVVEPVLSSTPSVPEAPSAVETTPVAVSSAPDTLIFDGSKETNLNVALGEASNEASVSVPNVEPIREFGQDEPVTAPVVNVETPVSAVSEPATTDSTTSSAGFANNKFFMVIAITFFLAACVFLGYEVVRYFQIVA